MHLTSDVSSSALGGGHPPELLEVGRVGKPHGLRGEVTITLVSNRPERLLPMAQFDTDLGPLRVATARTHGRRHIVAFAGVHDRVQAEQLRGLELRAEPLDDPDELWAHDLIGAEVIDQHGISRGVVAQIVANPASDLLELGSGVLVPVRFVTSVTPRSQVEVDAPDGLFELG